MTTIEKIKQCQVLIEQLANARTLADGNTVDKSIQDLAILKDQLSLPESGKSFAEITDVLLATYTAKNQDYGNSFEQSLDKFGIIASTVRLGDKMNRIESLTRCNNPQVKSESIRDTLLDLANYAIMTVMWLDKVSTGES